MESIPTGLEGSVFDIKFPTKSANVWLVRLFSEFNTLIDRVCIFMQRECPPPKRMFNQYNWLHRTAKLHTRHRL